MQAKVSTTATAEVNSSSRFVSVRLAICNEGQASDYLIEWMLAPLGGLQTENLKFRHKKPTLFSSASFLRQASAYLIAWMLAPLGGNVCNFFCIAIHFMDLIKNWLLNSSLILQ